MMSLPDMQVPISYALAYPKRISIKHPKLDLAKISKLNFLAPDTKKFSALKLVREVLEVDGNAPCIFNAANEIAVARFLEGEIEFTRIVKIVYKALEKIPYQKIATLEDVVMCNDAVKKLSITL
jgi:1-deoxy-D-xylulose-5-phosphate reductoisomerase